jgi:hypothetical protein
LRKLTICPITGRHLYAALALAVVALSPTVFAYPLNVVILALAIVELFGSAARRTHRR